MVWYDMINKPRKQNRLKDYDYSSKGYYFVTICTHNKAHIFGSVIDGKVQMNQFGCIATKEKTNICVFGNTSTRTQSNGTRTNTIQPVEKGLDPFASGGPISLRNIDKNVVI